MTQEYATPVAFRTALEHRLRDRAARQGTDLSRVRQILVFERFLERAFRVLGRDAVLKGGAALELRIARARTTRDIDLRVFGDPDSVLEQLRAAGREDLGDWLTFEIEPDREHPEIEAEGLRYGGRRFRAQGRIAGVAFGCPFGVDLAFAEPFHGNAETVAGSDILEFVGVTRPSFLIYPIEAHIAEKLHAYSMPRARPNSRVKDLPDIALLSTIREIDSGTLRAAIADVFDRRVRASLRLPTLGDPSTREWQRRTVFHGRRSRTSSLRRERSSIQFSRGWDRSEPGDRIDRSGRDVAGAIHRRDRLGGILRYCYRSAA
jgi:Nucleotidyl transferase AbiEii toxin, Type IV TA system